MHHTPLLQHSVSQSHHQRGRFPIVIVQKNSRLYVRPEVFGDLTDAGFPCSQSSDQQRGQGHVYGAPDVAHAEGALVSAVQDHGECRGGTETSQDVAEEGTVDGSGVATE